MTYLTLQCVSSSQPSSSWHYPKGFFDLPAELQRSIPYILDRQLLQKGLLCRYNTKINAGWYLQLAGWQHSLQWYKYGVGATQQLDHIRVRLPLWWAEVDLHVSKTGLCYKAIHMQASAVLNCDGARHLFSMLLQHLAVYRYCWYRAP